MAGETTHFGFIKPTYSEYDDIANQNSNWDKADTELHKRGTTVNGISPDDSGDYKVNEVPFAQQIVTDDAQQSSDEFQFRTTGGDASLTDGPAKLVSIFGRSTHTGIVEESLTMTVTAVPREEGEEEITATIDRDFFVGYVSSSATITLSYTNAWSANPALYGITVVGTPVSGDQIVVVYVKANRGTITNSAPSRFVSTGWNLYNHTNTYARAKKYSSTYGFLIGGTYTAVEYSATLTGTKQSITPASGYFTIPDDGYIWVTGGNSTDTYILMTWSDWGEGYEGDWQAYTESAISLSTIMTNFPNGLMQVGGVADEINFSMGMAISRIERIAYSDENMAAAIATGRPYDADTNYIYLVRSEDVTYTISETGDYTACDHGEEFIEGGTVPVYVQSLYGQNLVDKLRTDVVTKSSDIANNLTTTTSGKVLDARQGKALNDNIGKVKTQKDLGSFATVAALEALLDTELASMDSSSILTIRCNASAAASPFRNGLYYMGELYKSGTSVNYSHVVLYEAGGKPSIEGGKAGANNWTWTSLSDQIATKVITGGTVAQTGTNLYAEIANMADNQVANVKFTISTASDVFSATGVYFGELVRVSSTKGTIKCYLYSDPSTYIEGYCNAGTWTWTSISSSKCTRYGFPLTENSTVTWEFPNITAYLLIIERANTTSTTSTGLYSGYAHPSNGHIVPILACESCSVSISGKTLTISTTSKNMFAYVLALATTA